MNNSNRSFSKETFIYSPPLPIPGVFTCFIGRTPGLNVSMDRSEVLELLHPIQKKILNGFFTPDQTRMPFVIAEQIHGSEIAIINPPFSTKMFISGVDALITNHRDVILSINVADCAPVWIVERTGKAAAIVHSGKKGTLAGIVPKTIARLKHEFSIDPADLIVTIGPCIRPPCYEIDFAKIIHEQATEAGVTAIHDEQICTACNLEHYYSYRREKGKTGRMLGVLALLRCAEQLN